MGQRLLGAVDYLVRDASDRNVTGVLQSSTGAGRTELNRVRHRHVRNIRAALSVGCSDGAAMSVPPSHAPGTK